MNRVAITAADAGRNYQMRHERVSDCGFVAAEECELIGWISGNHKVGVWARLASHEDMDDWMCLYIVKLFVAPKRTSQGVGCRLIEELSVMRWMPAAISSLSFQMNQQT